MPHDRSLAASPFPGDDGSPNSQTRDALALSALDPPDSYLRAVAALCGDRVLVPVVATTTRLGETVAGPRNSPLNVEKEAEMSVVLLQRPDGERAAVGFTGLDTLSAWRSDARPVPVTLDVLARAARSERAVAVLIDPSGPYPLVLDGEILDSLAAGQRLVALADGFGWARPGGAE